MLDDVVASLLRETELKMIDRIFGSTIDPIPAQVEFGVMFLSAVFDRIPNQSVHERQVIALGCRGGPAKLINQAVGVTKKKCTGEGLLVAPNFQEQSLIGKMFSQSRSHGVVDLGYTPLLGKIVESCDEIGELTGLTAADDIQPRRLALVDRRPCRAAQLAPELFDRVPSVENER